MTSNKDEVEALDRRMRTLRKKIEETDAIFQRMKTGETLEPNQLTKLSTRRQREEELASSERKRREILVAGGMELCKSFGVCSNCGTPGHDSSQCPRPKNPAAASKNSISVRPASSAHTLPSKTSGPGRSRGLERERSSAGRGFPSAGCAVAVPADAGKCGSHQLDLEDEGLPRVLCVAEKPSVAKVIAQALSGGRQRIRTSAHACMCKLYDFYYYFPPANSKCSVTVTSVLGHVHTLDFEGVHHGDPANLYGAPVKKVVEDTSSEHGIEAHLAEAAKSCTYLFLWLDCDRGELSCLNLHFLSLNLPLTAPTCSEDV